ncbi:TIGR00730 family Rossman fold protein [Amycolatopsis sp. VS8301801F10]|uniref:LOG family protein n=1 Tax=Amycolatopsis sp. VS8301801F10 TaxID=2652442 RepID=UPI0038FC3DE5
MRICVFCGSARGFSPEYAEAAAGVGKLLAQRGIGLVYGGASVGTMGVVADAALAAGGEVFGVIPEVLSDVEIAHGGLTELHVVPDMHQRKAKMAALSDAFVALPGGVGTLEELFEVWTWAQLGIHRKPIGLLDVAGYYSPLVEFADQMLEKGFLRPETRQLISVASDAEKLIDLMARSAG